MVMINTKFPLASQDPSVLPPEEKTHEEVVMEAREMLSPEMLEKLDLVNAEIMAEVKGVGVDPPYEYCITCPALGRCAQDAMLELMVKSMFGR
jgi:hypothetical protein